MTRIALVAGVCSLVALGSAAAVPASETSLRASLKAIDQRPLVVRGTGFEANERVRLVLSSASAQVWRTAETGDGGRFTMGFGVSIGPCGRFTVQAVGSKGSRARLLPRRAQIACVSPARGGATTHGDSGK
jgi:hypothetical protein